MTYSIVARDPRTGELGVAAQSHWFSVGAVVPHVRAGVGAVATQSVPEPAHGARILDLLARGAPPEEALDAVLRGDEGAAMRQTSVVDAAGRVAVHTGHGCIADAGHHVGDGWACQANMMASAEVWPAMAEAFASGHDEPLAERMLDALDAAEAAGGDLRGRQSAAFAVGDAVVRVEDHPEPLRELRRLLVLHRAYQAANRADELMAEGRLEEAGAEFERAAVLAPGNPELLFWAGLAAAQAGDLPGGTERVRRAIEIHRPWREVLARLGPEHAPAAPAVLAALPAV